MDKASVDNVPLFLSWIFGFPMVIQTFRSETEAIDAAVKWILNNDRSSKAIGILSAAESSEEVVNAYAAYRSDGLFWVGRAEAERFIATSVRELERGDKPVPYSGTIQSGKSSVSATFRTHAELKEWFRSRGWPPRSNRESD